MVSVDVDLRDVKAGPDVGFIAQVQVPQKVGSGDQWTIQAWGLDDGDNANTPFQPTE
jgi:hypothetical protein